MGHTSRRVRRMSLHFNGFMKQVELRDYQQDMLVKLTCAWQSQRSVMVQMPTGTGKTVLLAEVIRKELESESLRQSLPVRQGGSVLVVAHRRELIEQIGQTIERFSPNSSAQVRVESIQKLSKHIGEVDYEPSLVIIDEAHHALARTYRMLWERWPKARFLGLTATPCRLRSAEGRLQGKNNAPFTDLFDTLLQSWTIQEFIDRGWLSDFEYVSASPESMALRQVRLLQKRGADGDYQTKEMATVMDVPESIEHLYKTYRQFAAEKKGIVYAIDREHARHIAEYYQAKGIACAVIDAKTPADIRQEVVGAYREGRLDVLVNVDIFSEGFDCPEVEFIQLARPTLSLSKYLQQVGRGMRISKGKDHVLILDNVGLYQTFGLPTDERDWKAFFYGQLAGKGTPTGTAPIIIRDDDADRRELVNLEMVRIRRRSEKPVGLCVYLQGGRYGVMRDGQPTTQPVFEQIVKCTDGLFYAYAIYPYQVYQNRKTVIDRNGTDLGVQLYGNLELRGEFLYGQDIKGGATLWDTIGRRYYQGQEPTFERVGGLDLIKTGKDEYELRYSRGLHMFRFRKSEVLFNQHIAIIRDKLIVKSEGYRVFNIFGFRKDQILTCGKKEYSAIPVSWDGRIGRYQEHLPHDFDYYPDLELLHLKGLFGAPLHQPAIAKAISPYG